MHTFSRILLILLTLIALVRVFQFADKVTHYDADYAAGDFRTPYLATHVFLEGKNFYKDSLIKNEWQRNVQNPAHLSDNPSGFPETPFLYPPWLLPWLVPIAMLPWSVACPLWYILCAVFLVGILWMLRHLLPAKQKAAWIIIMTSLAFKGTLFALWHGQLLFLSLFAGLAALYFYKKRKHTLAGLLLGICCVKITLALPFLLFFLVERRWSILALAGLGMILPSLLVLMAGVPPGELIASYRQMLAEQQYNVFILHNTAFENMTEAGTLLSLISGQAYFYKILLYPVLTVMMAVPMYYGYRRGVVSERMMLVIVAVFLFSVLYHLFYDLLLLLLLLTVLDEIHPSIRYGLLIAGIPLFLPVNEFLRLLHLPQSWNILFLSIPFVVLLMLGLLLWNVRLQLHGQRARSVASIID